MGPHPESGLATERTALAWSRSALALAAVAALAVRRGAQGDLPGFAYPLGVVLFAAAVAVWVLGASAYEGTLIGVRVTGPVPRRLAFRVMSIGTVAVAVSAIVLALF
jgi:uncharacterized membrane protein YidH (DUF202 family)